MRDNSNGEGGGIPGKGPGRPLKENSYRQQIVNCLSGYGPLSTKEISQITGIAYAKVGVTLQNGKNNPFEHLKAEKKWQCLRCYPGRGGEK